MRAALESHPEAHLCDIAAGEPAVCTRNGGEEYEMDIKEHALAGLGYVVACRFHELCFPFAIPKSKAENRNRLRYRRTANPSKLLQHTDYHS